MIGRVGLGSFVVTCALILLARRQVNVDNDSVERVRRDVDTLDMSGRIEFDELYDGTYSYSRFSATWSKIDSEYYFQSNSNTEPSIWRQRFNFDKFASTGDKTDGDKVSIVDKKWKDNCEGGCTTYYVSPNEEYVLFQKTNKQLWRRSYQKQFYVFSVAEQKVIETFFDEYNPTSNCLYAGWAPTGAKIAAVCGFNLFYLDPSADDVETQVT